jgi:hypothetical protein
MTQSLVGVLDAIFAAFTTAYAASTGPDGSPVLVSFGDPGSYQPAAIVALMETRIEVGRPTMGTARSREMVAESDLIVSVYAEGDQTRQQVATDSALALVTILEQYLRTSPNEGLGGASYDSWMSQLKVVPSVAYDPASQSPIGRVTECLATITTKIRY